MTHASPTGPEGPTPPKRKPGAGKRLASSLIALSSGAILSAYAFGYARTQSVADSVAAQAALTNPALAAAPAKPFGQDQPSPSGTTTERPSGEAFSGASASTPGGTVDPRLSANLSARGARPSVTPVADPSPGSTPTSAPVTGPYRDGTYVATGVSSHGRVQATVVVQGGRIVSAVVTRCSTRFPCSKLASLPRQVVARQSDRIDLISGATGSSLAYQAAITQALARAR